MRYCQYPICMSFIGYLATSWTSYKATPVHSHSVHSNIHSTYVLFNPPYLKFGKAKLTGTGGDPLQCDIDWATRRDVGCPVAVTLNEVLRSVFGIRLPCRRTGFDSWLAAKSPPPLPLSVDRLDAYWLLCGIKKKRNFANITMHNAPLSICISLSPIGRRQNGAVTKKTAKTWSHGPKKLTHVVGSLPAPVGSVNLPSYRDKRCAFTWIRNKYFHESSLNDFRPLLNAPFATADLWPITIKWKQNAPD